VCRFRTGGVIYVCGDGSRMEPDVRGAISALYRTKTGAEAAAASAWIDALTQANTTISMCGFDLAPA